jgi:NADPH:quinone reductase-like Zn-dependent oxidoreductase
MSLPKSIRSILLNTKTGRLALIQTSTPNPPSNEHLIRVHTTALTNGELTWAAYCPWPEQHVPGYDVAGTIVSEVPGSKFKIGDEIYGRVNAMREGTAREYATILPSETAIRPKGLTLEEASTIPMSAETAWQALFSEAGLQEPSTERLSENLAIGRGKRILITAASGGVGIFAVQLAKLIGAYVVGTCGSSNADFVGSLGADEVIDYRTTSVKNWVAGDEDKKFDVILEGSGKNVEELWGVLRQGGMMSAYAPGFAEPKDGIPDGVKGRWFVMESSGLQLEKISQFIEKGKLRTAVDKVYSMEQFQEAFDRAHSGRAKGKVVIKM